MQLALQTLRPAPLPSASRPRGRLAVALPAAKQRPRQLLTLASAAPAGAAAGAFDPAGPSVFYLPDLPADGRMELETLADATVVVEGQRLPVHASVLSVHSSVLRHLFADLRSSSQEAVGCNPTAEGQAGLVLEAPFQGATLFEACLFLRLCYRPCELSPADLATMLGSLPGLLRLAHKLDAPRVQEAVRTCMAGNSARIPHASVLQLMDWAVAADHCQLPDLRLSCLSEVARRLARDSGSGLVDAFVDAALLVQRCDKGVLAQLLALMADASTSYNVPDPEEAATALQQAANHGGFEWALERFSERPSAVGQSVQSPWIAAAGKEWRFEVYPGGASSTADGYLSVYLRSNEEDTNAKYSVALVDQTAESEPVAFGTCGHLKFICPQQLRARPGYLAGDRLLLRVRVEVVP